MIPNTTPSPPNVQSPTDGAVSLGSGSGAQTPTGPTPSFSVEGSVNLYISQVPASYNSTKLRDAFARFGPIHSAKVMFDPTTNESRCFGFVLFERAEDGHRAMSDMNGVVLEEGSGRLHVRVARPSALPQPLQNAANNNNYNNNNITTVSRSGATTPPQASHTSNAHHQQHRQQCIVTPPAVLSSPGPFVFHNVPQDSRMHVHHVVGSGGAASSGGATTMQVTLPALWIPNGPLLHTIPTTGGGELAASLAMSSMPMSSMTQSQAATGTSPVQQTVVHHIHGTQQPQQVWFGNYSGAQPMVMMMAPGGGVMQQFQPCSQ